MVGLPARGKSYIVKMLARYVTLPTSSRLHCMLGMKEPILLRHIHPSLTPTILSHSHGRYLRWCHIQVKVFNVGDYRRKVTITNASYKPFMPDPNLMRRQTNICV